MWHTVSAGDVIFVPAGTIHAIGAGLVIAEIQQRSDATFRLFDYGRKRELHIENAIAVADAGPAEFQVRPNRLTARTDASGFQSALRVRADRSGAKLRLVPGSGTRDLASRCRRRCPSPDRSTSPRATLFSRSRIASTFTPAPIGMVGLVAYTGGGPVPHLLQRLAQPGAIDVGRPPEMQVPTSSVEPKTAPTNGRMETIQMKPLQRVAFIGNHLPRRCGIATFTHDLHRAVSTARPDLETCVVAMTNPGRTYDYPPAVRFQIHDETIDDYAQAAEFLNNAGFDVVSLQHEYGIFGGEAGGNIIELLSRLEMPIVTTLHTVLAKPTPIQRDVMRQIIDTSAKIVVMSEKGREFLRSVHDVPARKIEVIPHGIPDFPFLETHHAKAKFGFAGKTIILTFGLLSPNKGIEIMLDAMPGIIKSCPNAVYVILGATHPNLVRHQGEAYREGLTARVRELGIEDHVVFFNQFVDQATLLDFISMCDVYVTPYLNEAQMTSGTLAYSFGLGKAVVSTPYWHAKELLSDGRGILVPFGDAKALSTEIAGLLTNDVRRHAMRKRAYAASRSMTWAQTAKRYLTVFETARENARPGISLPVDAIVSGSNGHIIPEIRIGHFLSLCDSTGMLQHAVHSVPDRSHGYCVDDNARALLFSSALASFWRSAIVRDDHRTLCGIHPARLESGHPSVSKFHELRPPMAGRAGLGRQSRQDALGVGRMRTQGH